MPLPLLYDVTLGPLGLQLLQLKFPNKCGHGKWSTNKNLNKIYFWTIKVVCESNISEVKSSLYIHSSPLGATTGVILFAPRGYFKNKTVNILPSSRQSK